MSAGRLVVGDADEFNLLGPYLRFGFMLERRLTYLSPIHGQFLLDMVTEEDIAAGRLGE